MRDAAGIARGGILHGVRCKPHYGLGMAEASQIKHPGKARKVLADPFTELGRVAATIP